MSKNLEIQYENKVYQVQAKGQGYTLRHAKITVCEAMDGSVTLLHKGLKLDYKRYEKGQAPAPLADEKTVNERVYLALKK